MDAFLISVFNRSRGGRGWEYEISLIRIFRWTRGGGAGHENDAPSVAEVAFTIQTFNGVGVVVKSNKVMLKVPYRPLN